MADWDEDSPRLLRNLVGVLREIRDAARRRDIPKVRDAREWQRTTMAGLDAPDPKYVGRFRGEVGLKTLGVRVGARQKAAVHVPCEVICSRSCAPRATRG